jgi:hypothetical protein
MLTSFKKTAAMLFVRRPPVSAEQKSPRKTSPPLLSTVDRPAIEPNRLSWRSAFLKGLHILVVALLAQAHQFATIKQIDVAVMRHDVMRDARCRDATMHVAALLAQRVLA